MPGLIYLDRYETTVQGSNTYLLVVIYKNKTRKSVNLNNVNYYSELKQNMQQTSRARKCA